MEIALLVVVTTLVVAVAGYVLLNNPTEVRVHVFPRERIKKFVIDRQFICPTAFCSVTIQYEIDTTGGRAFNVLLSVKRPDDSEQIIDRSLSFSQSFAGDNRIFNGPGEYIFTVAVTGGGLAGEVKEERTVTLLGPTGGIITFRPVFRSQSVASNRTNPVTISLSDVLDEKKTGAVICKNTTLEGIRFASADLALDFKILNVSGFPVAQGVLAAGTGATQIIPLNNRLDIELVLIGPNPFAADTLLTRPIELLIGCPNATPTTNPAQ
ncbi:hypothetical protein [Larkinella sp.]|uniref:hypothetical protein n=1 Tax=Larkinella sp. TaxID=2034517 RepID=UPI003BAD4D9A